MTPNAGRLFSVRTMCRLTDEMQSQSNAICAVGWSSARVTLRPEYDASKPVLIVS
jgi:hypothetical protein